MSQEELPLFRQVMIETVNRCNGSCAFCPANVNEEKRPYKKMSDELINKIIEELKEYNFDGNIYLNINNEPFLDRRLLDIAKEIKRDLPKARVCIITNGSLLTEETMLKSAMCVDELVINNYSNKYKLNDKIGQIYKFIKKNKGQFVNTSIVINRRYVGETLATRAGAAPNKPQKDIKINSSCIYPYTDIAIFPDGKVGICCNDCFETSDFGDVTTETLRQIWDNGKFNQLRKKMAQGREYWEFCRQCDVSDAGSREKMLKNK